MSEEYLTERAKTVLKLAEKEARLSSQNAISTDHLLLGLIIEGTGVAAQVLGTLGVPVLVVRQLAAEIKGTGQSVRTPPAVISLTIQAAVLVREGAKAEALRFGLDYVDTEHILLALVEKDDCEAAKILTLLGVSRKMIRDQMARVPSSPMPETPKPKYRAVTTRAARLAASVALTALPAVQTIQAEISPSILLRFGPNLVQGVRDRRINLTVGRKDEIQQIIRVLGRRTCNNPLLVGQRGVGKTATVIGVAAAIAAGKAGPLSSHGLYSLEVDSLLHEVRSQQELEERLRAIATAARDSKSLLFIDDLDAYPRPDTGWAKFDLWPTIRSILVSNDIRIIGTATGPDGRNRLMSVPGLANALYEVAIHEPNAGEAMAMIRTARRRYTSHHNVHIPLEVVPAAVQMAPHYDPLGFLPGSALDLLDETCSHIRMTNVPSQSGRIHIKNFDAAIAEVVAKKMESRNGRPSSQRAELGTHAATMSGSRGPTPTPHPSIINGDHGIWSMI